MKTEIKRSRKGEEKDLVPEEHKDILKHNFYWTFFLKLLERYVLILLPQLLQRSFTALFVSWLIDVPGMFHKLSFSFRSLKNASHTCDV